MVKFCLINATVTEHHELPLYGSDRSVPNDCIVPRFQAGNIFVTLFGRREDGTSMAVVLNNWRFHFFAELTDDQQAPSKIEPLIISLKNRLRKAQFEFVRRYKAVGYHGDSAGRRRFAFLKISFSSYGDGYFAKKYLIDAGFPVHEADSFSSQHRSIFIVNQLMEHLTLKAGTPETPCTWFSWLDVEEPGDSRAKYTHCAWETICRHEKIFLLPSEDPVVDPVLNMLCYDIECYSPDDTVFPEAECCPVIAIGNAVYRFDPCGTSGFQESICFSYAPSATVPVSVTREKAEDGSVFELRVFADELAMLEAWRDFVVSGDFDLVTGYNIWKFDNPYLMNRVRTLAPASGSRFFRLGKIMRHSIESTRRFKPQTCSSTAMGDNDMWLFNAPGVAEIDAFMLAKRLKGMTSLKLKDVSSGEIGCTKFDLPYTEMNVAYRAGDSRLVAEYCIQDARLPGLLLEKWRSLREYLELSKATYTPINALSSGGQQIKVRNMYFQVGHSMDFVFNTQKFSHGDYQGAIVITPKPGYYTFPVATLDFASLYPSCMMKDNLCPSTLVVAGNLLESNVPVVQLLEHRFVQNTAGIVPTMLRNLLDARSAAKKKMAEAKRNGRPSHEIAQFDYRQLSLKLCANSVYGFFNTEGAYKCMAVAESTTCSGRNAIERAVEIAESDEYRCEVIYGDTDSIMIRIPGASTVEAASSFAVRVAASVSESYEGKLSLVFEKVFKPYLLVKKKRYAGLKYTSPNEPPELDYKGFELVRRDSFPLCHELQRTLFNILIAPVPDDTPCLIQLAEDRRQAVVDYLSAIMQRFLDRAIAMDQLVMSKSLKRTYNNPNVIQHKVNMQIKQVTPGREFPPGDRVPFIIVNGDVIFQKNRVPVLRGRSTNIANRAVFFDFVGQHLIFTENVDWTYYVERLRPAVVQIMEYVSHEKIKEITQLFLTTSDVLRRSMRTFSDCSHRDIDSFFGPADPTVQEAQVVFADPPLRIDLGPEKKQPKRKLPSRSKAKGPAGPAGPAGLAGPAGPAAKKPRMAAAPSAPVFKKLSAFFC